MGHVRHSFHGGVDMVQVECGESQQAEDDENHVHEYKISIIQFLIPAQHSI